uniref:hypothetical protein n=1 Tax=Thermonema rossianum TaxID=55505 RepID=UPI0005715E6A
GDLKSYKQVQFRNVQTGEYIISWNDPRGGGVLESSQKPDDKGFRFYQAANAAPGNCEIKRIGWDAFNWSAYPKFIAVNHAKRIPNTTAPNAPHAWNIEQVGSGVFIIKSGDACVTLVPGEKTHLNGPGSAVRLEKCQSGNKLQQWEIYVISE